MNYIRDSIDLSKKWKFNRQIFYQDKLIRTIKDGIIEWFEVEPNVFSHTEKGEFKLNNQIEKFKKIYKFVFSKDKSYKVYKCNNRLFYTSNSKNKKITIDNDTIFVIEFLKTDKQKLQLTITSNSNDYKVKVITEYFLF